MLRDCVVIANGALVCIFHVLLTMHPCIISQISPTRRTILLNILISLLYVFRASTYPSSCWLDWIQPADQTPPIQSDEYQCRIDTVIFSWWWACGCLKHVEKRNKYIKQNCAPSWTYLWKNRCECWTSALAWQPTALPPGKTHWCLLNIATSKNRKKSFAAIRNLFLLHQSFSM